MPLSLEVRWLWCNASLARCVGSGQHTLALGRRQCRHCLTRKTHNLTALFCLSLGQVTFAAYLAVLLGTFVPVTFLIVLYSQVTRKCARFSRGATLEHSRATLAPGRCSSPRCPCRYASPRYALQRTPTRTSSLFPITLSAPPHLTHSLRHARPVSARASSKWTEQFLNISLYFIQNSA